MTVQVPRIIATGGKIKKGLKPRILCHTPAFAPGALFTSLCFCYETPGEGHARGSGTPRLGAPVNIRGHTLFHHPEKGTPYPLPGANKKLLVSPVFPISRQLQSMASSQGGALWSGPGRRRSVLGLEAKRGKGQQGSPLCKPGLLRRF